MVRYSVKILGNKTTTFLRELNDFLRIKICLYMFFIGLSGYFLFNAPSWSSLLVGAYAFFSAATIYCYNNMTDEKEDRVNKRKISGFFYNKKGYAVTGFCFFAALLCALLMPAYSLVVSVIGLAGGMVYSFFRLKRYIVVKNLYTGFGVGHFFLAGALMNSAFNMAVIGYYTAVSFFVVIISMISDLRDYEGDRAAGVNTIPVRIGYEKACSIVVAMIMAFSLFVVVFRELAIMLPFCAVMLMSIKKNRPLLAHSIGGHSFMFLVIWLLL